MNPADLIGLYEVAELAGVSPPAVANWRRRNLNFPAPFVELKSGPVFRKAEIGAWLARRMETWSEMAKNTVRIGLRLLEFESGVAANIDDANSAELVDYEISRAAGQAARLAMLIRGQDVIEDEQRLKKIAAVELGLHPAEFTIAKQLLMEADLIEERTTKTGKSVLNEKVSRINHSDNYRRVGELWLSRNERTEKEDAIIHTLDSIVETPKAISDLAALLSLKKNDRSAVLELGTNAGILESVDEARNVYFSPLLWDVNPKKLGSFLKTASATSFGELLQRLKKPGSDVTNVTEPLIAQAVSGGIFPSYGVVSTGGRRVYSFTPYTGGLLISDTQKTILDKARAIIACLRYGSEAATITKIRNPLAILNALTDQARDYGLKPHSELKLQYGMLVSKQIGRVIQTGDRYAFRLIPTDDNLKACSIAQELLSAGELMAEKDLGATAALHMVNGTIQHPLKEVKVARKKRPARADELNDLVERLQVV
ncbi:MAG: helix-turn-helix transcriptional regulator [Terriglobia bacterium]